MGGGFVACLRALWKCVIIAKVILYYQVDRVYDWSPARKGEYFADTLKRQSESTLSHLHTLVLLKAWSLSER